MKRILSFLLSLVWLVAGHAQEVQPYALVKEGATATYAVYRGEKKKLNMGMSYLENKVYKVKELGDGSKEVTYCMNILNKKKKLTKMGGMIGTDGGLYTMITIDPSGSYKMDNDMCFGIAKDIKRGGYMFEVPGEMKVGDRLSSSICKQTYKMMGKNLSSAISYDNLTVEDEETITVGAGTFNCMKVSGSLSGEYNKFKFSDQKFTYWMAPGVGIVRYKIHHLGETVYFELDTL